VLSNITVEDMTPLLRSDLLARAAALTVRGGYLLSLMGSFVLLLFPLRHVLADVLLGGHDALSSRWVPVTACIVGTSYFTACFLPTIWGALTLVGATATTTLSWIIPALLILAVERIVARSESGGEPASGVLKGLAAVQRVEGGGARDAARAGGGRRVRFANSGVAGSDEERKSQLLARADGGVDGDNDVVDCDDDVYGSSKAAPLLKPAASGARSRRACNERAAVQAVSVLIFVIGMLMFANAILDALLKNVTAGPPGGGA